VPVFQAKGKEHCREMKRDAWYLYKEDTQGNTFDDCLRMAIEMHRKRIEAEIRYNLRSEQDIERQLYAG
jgi:hypothetical protein